MNKKGLFHKSDHWEGSYSWIHNPKDLPDNRVAAMHLWNLENKRMYIEQVENMADRDVSWKLSASKFSTYNVPVFSLSRHEVLKADSTSTSCRKKCSIFQPISKAMYWIIIGQKDMNF